MANDRIVMRTGEALVEGDKDYLCAEPRVGCEAPLRVVPYGGIGMVTTLRLG